MIVEGGMDHKRKHAYRLMLYWAMLEIRPLRWSGSGWRHRLNPFVWWSDSRQVRIAGGIADWLHNLAQYSAFDFEHFDESWFWRDYDWLLKTYPDANLEHYRAKFNRLIAYAEPPSTTTDSA